MASAQELCRQIDTAQNLYAEYFGLLETSFTKDPTQEDEAIEEWNKKIADCREKITRSTESLKRELDAWRDNQSDYPPGVNQYAHQFLELMEQGVKEALTLIDRRTGEISAQRDELKKAIQTTQNLRNKVSGYRVQAHKSARMFDSDI